MAMWENGTRSWSTLPIWRPEQHSPGMIHPLLEPSFCSKSSVPFGMIWTAATWIASENKTSWWLRPTKGASWVWQFASSEPSLSPFTSTFLKLFCCGYYFSQISVQFFIEMLKAWIWAINHLWKLPATFWFSKRLLSVLTYTGKCINLQKNGRHIHEYLKRNVRTKLVW